MIRVNKAVEGPVWRAAAGGSRGGGWRLPAVAVAVRRRRRVGRSPYPWNSSKINVPVPVRNRVLIQACLTSDRLPEIRFCFLSVGIPSTRFGRVFF